MYRFLGKFINFVLFGICWKKSTVEILLSQKKTIFYQANEKQNASSYQHRLFQQWECVAIMRQDYLIFMSKLLEIHQEIYSDKV